MKYDEKTGNRIPESRMDEIKISMDKLKEMSQNCDGMLDSSIETSWMLRDISVSLAQVVDIGITLLSRLISKGIIDSGEVKKEEKPTVKQ